MSLPVPGLVLLGAGLCSGVLRPRGPSCGPRTEISQTVRSPGWEGASSDARCL